VATICATSATRSPSTIGELKQAGEEEAAQEAIERSQEVKSELQEIEERADELEAELEESLLELPQIPTSRCRSGPTSRRTSSDAARGSTTCARFPTTWSPTTIWARELEILDFERGAKVAGGGYVAKGGDGARLEHALIQFMLDVHREQDYRDVFPPIAVNSTSMRGTGQLPEVHRGRLPDRGDQRGRVRRRRRPLAAPDRGGARHEPPPRRDPARRGPPAQVPGVHAELPAGGG